jgi:hypothetical protein
LKPTDSVSVSPAPAGVWRDNRLRAYSGQPQSGLDIHGLLKFDLSSIPDNSSVVSMKLTCTLENGFSSPRNGPVVNLHYCADDSWSRATATAGSAPLGALLTANQQTFAFPVHVFTIDVKAHTWAVDLLDNTLTLAIDNTNPAYSYIYFFGANGSPAGTPPELEITVQPGGCNGMITTIGTGGRDSTGAVVRAVTSGCPQLGSLLHVGADFGANVPMTVYVGLTDFAWLGVLLPLDLTNFGAPGNSIYVAASVAVGGRLGAGTVPISIPNQSVYKGVTFFAQAAILDAQANGMGLVTSPGMKITVSTQ